MLFPFFFLDVRINREQTKLCISIKLWIWEEGEAAAHQIFGKFDLSRIEINSEQGGNSRKNYKLVENSRKFTTTYKII